MTPIKFLVNQTRLLKVIILIKKKAYRLCFIRLKHNIPGASMLMLKAVFTTFIKSGLADKYSKKTFALFMLGTTTKSTRLLGRSNVDSIIFKHYIT